MKRKVEQLSAHTQVSPDNISGEIISPLKVKVPQQLPLQILYTTDYLEYCVYFLRVIQKLQRKTEEHKAAVRMYRRLLTLHLKQYNERRKAVATLLILKSILGDKTFFTNTVKEKRALAAQCEQLHYQTFESYLKVIESLGLVEYRNGKAFVASYVKICERFGIQEQFIRNHFVLLQGLPLQKKLKRIAMQKKELHCQRTANDKLNKVHELQHLVSSISGKSNLEAVNDLQEQVFLNRSLINAFDIDTYLLFDICRGDSSLSYRYWSCLFGYKSFGGFKHVKRELITAGLIAVFPRKVVVDVRKFKGLKSRSCCLGTIVYNRTEQTATFIKPDSIHYLSLNV